MTNKEQTIEGVTWWYHRFACLSWHVYVYFNVQGLSAFLNNLLLYSLQMFQLTIYNKNYEIIYLITKSSKFRC